MSTEANINNKKYKNNCLTTVFILFVVWYDKCYLITRIFVAAPLSPVAS